MRPDYIISDLWPLVVEIDEVQVDPSNAMTHDEVNLDQIAGSLNKHKQRKPIVINRATGTVEAGNGALIAARRLGWRYIAVVGEEDDAQTAVSYGIADNAVASDVWDWQRLKKHLDTFEEPQDVPGVDDELLTTLKEALAAEKLNGKAGGDAPPQVDRAAELQKEYGTAVGQIWRLGPHRLAVGNCTDRAVVERLIGGNDVDLVLTDPPYSVNYGQKNRALNSIGPSNRIEADIKNDTLSTEDTAELIWRPAFRNAYTKSRNGTVFYCFSPQGGDQMMMMMMIKAEWNERLHQLIWRKNSPTFSMGRLDYQYQHEPILYTWRGTNHGYYSEVGRSIIDCDRPNVSKLHPTMKPVELLEVFIANSSKPNELVYDPFLGSGSTMVAAHQLNRRCFGIEIDPGYAAVCLRRWEELTGEKAEKIANGKW